MHKFYNVFEVIEEKKDTSECEWLLLKDDDTNYYYHIRDVKEPQEKAFYVEICNLIDEALYMDVYLTDCGPRENGQGIKIHQTVEKEELRAACVRLSKEYREYVQELEKYPYMTFAYLKEIMETHNIPEDVRLMSDSGWECDATDMEGAFYHKEDNIMVFTQSARYSDSDFYKGNGWKEVSHKWTEKEGFFQSIWRNYNQKKEMGIMITDEDYRRAIEETIEFDKKMQDSEFVKRMEIEMERMRNLDLDQFFKADDFE